MFVNKIGGGIVDVTKKVGDFFEHKIGGSIVDFGKKVGDSEYLFTLNKIQQIGCDSTKLKGYLFYVLPNLLF